MKVQVHTNPKHPDGLHIAFSYNEYQANKDRVRRVLGLTWENKDKYWGSVGPEILLDMQRFGIEIEWMSSDARKICEGFRQQLWDVMDARTNEYEEEWGFQHQGTDILKAIPFIILGDDMGLGKSKQALDAAIACNSSSILILCPKTLTFNWLNEVSKWHPEVEAGVIPDERISKLVKRRGSKEKEKVTGRDEFWQNRPRIVISNYEKLLLNDWPKNIQWDTVILDEASRLKNSSNVTYKKVKKEIQNCTRAWALTGTPLEIKVMELYNILGLLRPAVLGGYKRFLDEHCETDWGGSVVGVKRLELLRERISPFILRRTKEEVLTQLPGRIRNNVFVKLSANEENAYDLLTSEFNNWLSEHGVSGGGDPLTQIIRMRQFCCTPQLWTDELGRGSKFEMLKDIVEEWDGQILIFCFFKEVVKLLQNWLGANSEALISGDVSDPKERFRRCQEFNAGRLGKVFLSTDAGGMGLNLTGANMVVHYDQLFNPQKMNQRRDRIHRIGQKSVITEVNMLCLDTIDVGMYQLNRERERLFEEVVEGAEEAILRKLDAPRLRRLIQGRLNNERIE